MINSKLSKDQGHENHELFFVQIRTTLDDYSYNDCKTYKMFINL